MSSKDRRVVHLTLKDHEHVTTESRGEGLRRKVVIVPKVKAETNSEVPQPAQVMNAEPVQVNAPERNELEEKQPLVSEQPEPGNIILPEPELDDNIGNRV
jgi:hypothetical protein